MNTLSYKTISANFKTVDKKWILVDANGEKLGRVCSLIAKMIRGKHKPNYTPHVDCGDNVIVINANKIDLSGNKWNSKEYISYSGYQGGQKSILAKDVMVKKPTFMVENAVRGMLPKNRLGRELFRNLYVYQGDTHDKEAQKPIKVSIKDIK